MKKLSDYAGYLLIIGGLIQIASVIFRLNWFVKLGRVKRFYDLIGEKLATIIYTAIGAIVIFFGIMMIIE